MPSSLVNVHKMTDLSLDEVKRMSELSRGVAMEVTQPSCLFFFTFVFVGYYYEEEEEENVSHKTHFTPTHVMRRRLRRRRRKIHHCHHQKGSRRRMKMIDDDDDDFLNLIRLCIKRRKKIQQNRAHIKKVKTYETRTRKPTLRGRLLKLKFPYLCFISLLLLAFVKTSW